MQQVLLNKSLLFIAIVFSFLFFACSGEPETEKSSSSVQEPSSSSSDALSSSSLEQSSSSSIALSSSSLEQSSSSSIESSSSSLEQSSSSSIALSSSSRAQSSSSSIAPSSSSRAQSSSSSITPSSSSRAQSSSSSITPSSSSRAQSSSSSIVPSSSSLAQSSSSVCSQVSKACIDAEINANWQRLGYSSKPTKVIALSFDDGPCTGTQSLLTALKNKEVKTTFFVIGQNIRGNKAAATAIYNDGHELANHSDGYSGLGNSANARSSLEACNTEIKGITGQNATLFRAPNVEYGTQLTQACTSLNLPLIGVSCWSNDYNGLNATTIRNNVKSCAGDGKIVNLHEFNTATGNNAAGIEGLIDDLRAAGYWILPVGQMAVYKGRTLTGGTQYDSF